MSSQNLANFPLKLIKSNKNSTFFSLLNKSLFINFESDYENLLILPSIVCEALSYNNLVHGRSLNQVQVQGIVPYGCIHKGEIKGYLTRFHTLYVKYKFK